MPQVTVESLDQEGRGVAHFDGKVIFIDGALPGEIVEYSSYRRKPRSAVANFPMLGKIWATSTGDAPNHFASVAPY